LIAHRLAGPLRLDRRARCLAKLFFHCSQFRLHALDFDAGASDDLLEFARPCSDLLASALGRREFLEIRLELLAKARQLGLGLR
jgi:hypothetical protein